VTLPPLWRHQSRELELNHHKPKLALFWSPRTGKTRAAAEDAKKSGLRRIVVSAPLSVCPDWATMFEALGFATVVRAYEHRVADLVGLRPLRQAGAVVVINDDKLDRGIDELLRWGPEYYICDECHRGKAPRGRRSMAMRRLSKSATRVRLLSGTPAPNHYGDLWAPMNGLDGDAWENSFGAFREKYLIYDPMFKSRIYGHKNTEQLQALILRFASIVRREDIFGPDDWQYVTRHVELPSKARRLYDDFAREWMISSPDLSASNTLVRILRLRQIAGGFIEDEQSGVIEILHTALIERLMADLSEIVQSDEKAIVYYKFRWEGARAAQQAKAELRVPVYEYHGDVDTDARKRIEREFNGKPGARIAFVQLQTGGLGVSFADAGHLMFLSLDFSFADVEQARDRVYAPDPELGKGKRRVIYSYRAQDTIHDFIGEVLDRKGDVHSALRNADREAIAYGSFKRRRKVS
jgi:SNF2-related domain/Helicase conserved C-terminal domain